jgi:hypothetical protein
MAMMTGDGHLLTADEGDADDREKHRDAQNQSAIHPRILQQNGLTWNVNSYGAVRRSRPRLGRQSNEGDNQP